MIGRVVLADIIVYFVKSFIMNLCIYYSFSNIINKRNINKIKTVLFLFFNIAMSLALAYINYSWDSGVLKLIIYTIMGILLASLTKNNIGYSLIVTIVSYAICNIILFLSAVINFIPYNIIYKGNYYLNTASVLIVQIVLIYGFFKIRKFKNGFVFLSKKMNNDIADVILCLLSVVTMITITVMSTLYDVVKYLGYDFIITLILLSVAMFIMIQRTLTMHYKQTQLLKTMEEYKNELIEKDKQIEKLSKEKYNTSKIRHEFYYRQKALEMLVASQYNKENIDSHDQNIMNIINELTKEYSYECDKIKGLEELDKTGIAEIDSMFKYMQNECAKNYINFKLKIIGNIYPLINNIIPKSRLETLIGDHIKDAINAVNNEDIVNREILAVLGINEECYELVIHDTGKEFEIDTLLKLGKEKVTTCLDKGGSGIGFITTFETLAMTKASLIITENKIDSQIYYTKSVAIRFDGKQQYIINSYRANDIALKNSDGRIIVKELK